VGLAVVVVVGALSTAGAAMAATGHLSGPIRQASRNLLTTVGATPPSTTAGPSSQPAHGADNAGAGGLAATGQGAPTAGTAGTGSDPTAAAPVAGAAKDALCQAFMAGRGAEQGKKADAAAFEALARAAGGADKVPAFCQATAPGGAKPKKDRPAPSSTPGGQGPGQGGPPPGNGAGGQGQGGPPDAPPAGR
jgi:hypothetical protein